MISRFFVISLSKLPKANSQKGLFPFFSSAFLLLCSLALLFCVLPAFSQQTWTKTYGGWSTDEGEYVQQTSGGGYIIAGYTLSFGAGWWDAYLIKTSTSGDTLWTRTYGGTDIEWVSSVQQTPDGGYVMAGNTGSFGAGGGDAWLIKTDSLGATLRTKTYGGTYSDYGSSVQQTSDGGYIIAGGTRSYSSGHDMDFYLIKTNVSGDTLWTRTYGGTGNDWGFWVQQTLDSGYVIAGYTNSFGAGGNDVYLIKTNVSGDTLWTRTYGGAGEEEGYQVRQTSDRGYIITGYTTSFGAGGKDIYLIKTDTFGDTLWTRTYGGQYSDVGNSVQLTTVGGYIIAGETYSFGSGSGDVWLINTNATGVILWAKTYGGTASDKGFSVQQTQDGGYIIAGGTLSFGAGYEDVYLIKTDASGNVGVAEEESASLHPAPKTSHNTVTPNPFVSFTSLPRHESERFTLYDISGKRVGVYKGDRLGEGLPAGVYFIKQEQSGFKPLRLVKLR